MSERSILPGDPVRVQEPPAGASRRILEGYPGPRGGRGFIDDPEVLGADIAEFEATMQAYLAGELAAEAWKPYRLVRGIYGIRGQKDVQMVRVKAPQGELTAAQLVCLGEIAQVYADGKGHVTTRQDLQFHWVALEQVPEVLRRLAEVGLTTREACSNSVRNVTGCPLAGTCSEEVFNVRPYAQAVARYFLRHPLSQNMPRKFKIAFSGCGSDCIAATINDIGAIATVGLVHGQLERGFRLYLGGGLGSIPRVAQPLEDFTPGGHLLPTCEALIRLFQELGNRKKRHRARMKFVVDRLGIEEFRRRVLALREELLTSGPAWPAIEERDDEEPPDSLGPPFDLRPASPTAEWERWRETNVVPQRQPGYVSVYIRLPRGDLQSSQFRVLASVADWFSEGSVRTTIQQNVVLRWVREEWLPALFSILAPVGLGMPGAETFADVTCCPGADTCNLAITKSRGLAAALNEAFGKGNGTWEGLDGVRIKISGCPNSCGQHHLASLGFCGSVRRRGDHAVPHYQLFLGGRAEGGQTTLGRSIMRLPAKRIPEVVTRLVDLYRSQRWEGETFPDFFGRLGKAAVQAALSELAELVDYEEDPGLYRDWDEDHDFVVVTGEGECGQ